jgi:branched-chain amino acid transport system permease protein
MKNKNLYIALGIISLAALLLFPPILPPFQLRMVTEIVILALFALTWNMIFHYAGLLSFGHSAYFGIGAYASVLGWLHIKSLSFLSGILLGGFVAGVLGFVLGAFLVRMRGTYFALLTLAFNQLIWAIVWKWRNITGGDDGLGKFSKPALLGIISMTDPKYFYWTSLVIIGIGVFICWYITKTPFGNVIIAIKSNEERAQFIGFNTNVSKLIIFPIAGFFAGIAGALYAQLQEFIAPSTIDLGMSTNVLFMAFIGGTGSFLGPILGSGIFVYLSEYLSILTDRWEFILGFIFVIIVIFAPQGFLGLYKK